MSQRQKTIILKGGLDIVTPAIAVRSGFCIAGLNYEPEARGYRRSAGYERFDGRPKPSLASYWELFFLNGSTEITAGQTVTGLTSGATGIAVFTATLDSGSYGGGDADGKVVLYNVSGTFQDGEDIQVSAVTVCTCDGVPLENGNAVQAENDTNIQGAIEARRAVIAAVPGSGPIRGVWSYNGDTYAFRDNAGGTAGVMHKATSAGWVAQFLGHTIDFSSGGSEFLEGETLTGGTSGATATIERVVRLSGSWPPSAAGFLVLSGITGTFSIGEAITSASGNATADTSQEAITLPPGGTYRFLNKNFTGSVSGKRMYAANGVGKAFEWDGSIFDPIRTGLSDALDKPTHIGEHKMHLFLAYPGGTVQYSAIGEPLLYEVVSGAGEVGFGEDLTGLLSNASTSLVFIGRNQIGYLTGSSSADFDLKIISGESGGMEDTAQVVAGSPVYVDDEGLRKLSTTQAFGDWKMGTLSRLVEPIMSTNKNSGITPIGSLRVRSKDQYRLYYSDGTGLTVYFGRRDPEILPIRVEFTPSCMISSEDANGNEILFAGSSDGFVYQMDSGTSFDGTTLTANLRLAYDALGAIEIDKRYHGVILEVDAAAETALSVAADFSYGEDIGGSSQPFNISGGGGFWNEVNWNEFYWSAAAQGKARADINGVGSNISISVLSQTTYEEPHTLSALTIRYSPRRMIR